MACDLGIYRRLVERVWESMGGRQVGLLVVPPSRRSLEALTDAAVLLTVAKYA
ncbi:hypothetical protein [Actinomadura sp. 7K507]|uniref:hypothetical protein n=1 Tax=Actinomadura sp. 7K507 TaxID=2530365 RepID=UPI001A9F1511|nr:hypothetical protein [Actinomadura sp. 7K507]